MFKKIASLLTSAAQTAEQAAARPAPTGMNAIYLSDSEVNTLRLMLSGSATRLQNERKQAKAFARIAYDLSDKDRAEDPQVAAAFAALNEVKDYVRTNRKIEKKVNGIIRALRQRNPI